MNRNFFRTCTLIGALGALAACGESTVGPKSEIAPSGPSFTATVPFNNGGVCMADDAVAAPTGTIDGVKNGDDPLTATNCTSNDVRIATTTLNSYRLSDGQGGFLPPVTFNPGDIVNCNEGDQIVLNLNAKLEETANSARSDIGIWIATDGGDALTGACNHYNLVPGSGGVTNPDNDSCGDLNAGAVVPAFPLGDITAVCETATNTSTLLHVGSCLGWKEPGADTACPLASQGATPDGFRWGTLYANKSKCNCDGFDVPIIVNRVAHLEVVKACVPSNDAGKFNLQIDAVTKTTDAACGGTTGRLEVGAGTNVNPGAAHTFGELAGTNTNLSDYTSTRSCVNVVGGATRLASAAGTGGSVTLQPNDDVICTITNTRKPRLTVVKRVKNDNGGTKVADDFGIATDAGALTFGAGVADGANILKYTSNTITVAAGTYSLTENNVTGYAEGTWSCTGVAGSVVGTFSAGSVVIAAGENAVCTITNDDSQGSLQLIKRVKNDNGGTKVANDFGVNTNAGAFTFAAGVADGANILKYVGTTIAVNAGSYSLKENNVTGYDEGTWSCTGATPTNTSFDNGSVDVALEGVVVCTITNDDQPATLKIIKQVKGAGGSFPFTTTGSGLSDFTLSPATDASDTKTFTGLSAGVAMTVTESDPAPSYVLTDLGCDDQGTIYDPAVTRTVNVTLTNGATVTCTFVNEAKTGSTTRTQGFWATHSSITDKAWFGGSIGGNTFTGVSDKTLCPGPTKDLNTLGRVLGGFWSNIAQKTDKTKRSSLDQARMQLVQQLLAAILNNSVFGSVPSGPISIQQAEDAYCGTDIAKIQAAIGAMGAFNESGDSGVFTPGASANGKLAKTLADLAYWNTLP
jgi:hypothetical protein